MVEWLGEAGIGHRGREARGIEVFRCQQGIGKARAEARIATLELCLMTRPLPISRIEPRAGISTPTPSPRG